MQPEMQSLARLCMDFRKDKNTNPPGVASWVTGLHYCLLHTFVFPEIHGYHKSVLLSAVSLTIFLIHSFNLSIAGAVRL
jgi:hypothetical protein